MKSEEGKASKVTPTRRSTKISGDLEMTRPPTTLLNYLTISIPTLAFSADHPCGVPPSNLRGPIRKVTRRPAPALTYLQSERRT